MVSPSFIPRSKALWEKAVAVPYEVSARSAAKLRSQFPTATPAQLVAIAHNRFIRRVSTESAVVGSAAAFPGAGTVVSMGASGVQLTAFVAEAAHHALVVAHLHGLDMHDPAKRNALVLSALTGQEGAELISTQVGVQTLSWFRSSFLDIRSISAEKFNSLLLKWIQRKTTSSVVSATVGRMIPFGIGAVVGWGVGRSMARKLVEGLELALGPAPDSFADPIEITYDTTEGALESRFVDIELPR